MKGYVKNVSRVPQYVLKRTVLPNDIINVDELTAKYLDKSGAKNAKQFVEWLRKYVFEGTAKWEIDIIDRNVSKGSSKKKAEAPANNDKGSVVESKPSTNDGTKSTTKIVGGKVGNVVPTITAQDLIKGAYKKCEGMISKCKDPKVLKEALQKAMTMPRKEKVCKLLRERLAELV